MTSPTLSTTPSNLPSATATVSGASEDAASTIPATDAVASPDPPAPTVSHSGTSDAGGATLAFDKRKFTVVNGRLLRKPEPEFQRYKVSEGQVKPARPPKEPYVGARRSRARAQGHLSQRRMTQPVVREQMAAMKAAGMTDPAIARAFALNPSTVRAHLSTPEMTEIVAKHRAFFRAMASEQAAQIVHKAFSRANDALEQDDAKAFDSYTRGISALERTAASASGENKPASVNVAVGVQTTLSAEERDELLREFRKTIAVEAERG